MSSHDLSSNLQPFKVEISKLSSLSHLKTRTDDEFLIRFLKTAKNDLPKSVKRYEDYHKVLESLPHADLIMSGEREKYSYLIDAMKKINEGDDTMSYFGRDSQGRHMVGFDATAFIRLLNNETEDGGCNKENEVLFDASMIMCVLLLDYLMETYLDIQDQGLITMEDQSNFNMKAMAASMKHFSKMKCFAKIMDGTMPIRFSKCFIIDGPTLMTALFNLFKPFLSQKIIDKMTMVSGNSQLREYVGGDEFLPKMFKGQRTKQAMDIDWEAQLKKAFPTVEDYVVDC